MRRVCYVVSNETQSIIYTKMIRTMEWKILYAVPPKERSASLLTHFGFCCACVGLVLGGINLIFPFTLPTLIEKFSVVLLCLYPIFALIATTLYKRVSNNENDGNNKNHVVVGTAWSDPYHLLSKYLDHTPDKKLYYIVDSETNAIVDVKRLGKWGQAYIEWRSRRQKEKA